MKRIGSIAVVLLVMTTVVVVARPHRGAMDRGVMDRGMMDQPETSLTGRVILAEDTAPRLMVAGDAYTLRMPRMLPEGVQIQNNSTMTMYGVVREISSRDLLTTERTMMVRAVEQNGERLDLMPAGHRATVQRGPATPAPRRDMNPRGMNPRDMRQQDMGRRGR